MSYIVSKFGGSSVAAGLEGIHNIALDEGHDVVVLSGPGGSPKLTDILISCGETCDPSYLPLVMEKFKPLAGGENLTPFADTLEQRMKADINPDKKLASIKAFGEEVTAKLFAKRFGFKFIDPLDLIKVEGGYDSAFVTPHAYNQILEILGREKQPCVVPGFYGATREGHIATFKRGGGDYTGSIIAAALIDVFPGLEYHNFSDKDGIMAADPRVVRNPRKIDDLTYREYFCLARSGGFSIFQKEAVLPISEKNVQLYVRNTFNPDERGTLVKEKRLANNDLPFIGIGKEDGYSAINVYHPNMENMVGVVNNVTGLFNVLGIPISAVPTSDPGISIVFRESDLNNDLVILNADNQIERALDNLLSTYARNMPLEGKSELKYMVQEAITPYVDGNAKEKIQMAGIKSYLLETFEERIPGSTCGYYPEISRIVVLGKELKGQKAISGRIQTSLGLNGCNILFISQGLDELQLTLGVEAEAVNEGVKAVYDNFLR